MDKLSRSLSENVDYDFSDYPAYIRRAFLSSYPNYSALSHWHNDVEFLYVLSGKLKYNVNGKIIEIKSGECIFVNSRQLHYGFSDTREECIFLCILLHPMQLCSTSAIEKKYVTPLISNSAFSFCLLNNEEEWQKSIIDNISRLYFSLDKACPELFIQSIFYDIWLKLFENMPQENMTREDISFDLSAVKNMLKFIHDNYSAKISLDEIALMGKVCKNKCCQLFKSYLNKSPVKYLISYRLEKSVELLKNTDKNITEIAFDVGFTGTSYYVETFRKQYGESPKIFRKNNFGGN